MRDFEQKSEEQIPNSDVLIHMVLEAETIGKILMEVGAVLLQICSTRGGDHLQNSDGGRCRPHTYGAGGGDYLKNSEVLNLLIEIIKKLF